MAVEQNASESTIEHIRFKGDERDQLGKRIMEKVNSARSGMEPMFKRMEGWTRFYESDLPGKDFPWPNCSNVNVPLIQSHVDTWHSSLNDTMLNPTPWILVRAPANVSEPHVREAALAVQDALYQVQDTLVGLRSVVDQWNLNAIMQPAAIVKCRWAEEYRTVKRTAPVIDDVTGMPQVDEMGEPVMKPQSQKEPKYRGPKPEPVDLKNFVIFPLTASSIEDAEIVGDRFRMTEDGIRRKIKDGLWDKEAAEWCIERMASEAGSADDKQDEVEGIESLSDFDVLWFWELIVPYDADGDGLKEDCVFTVEADTGKIVRAVTFPYYHGRRHYIAQRPFKRAGQRFFGRTLPQILEHCQKEINTIHNQRVDGTSIAISPPFLRMRTSDLDADQAEFYPGAELQVDSMDEIQQMAISPLIPGIDIEHEAKDWSERASPINDLAMGRQTEGAKKTLGEVQLVTAKAGLRISDVINRLQYEGMVELAAQTLGLMYQFMSDEELQHLNLTRDLLTVPWDLIPHGNLGTADKKLRRQEADLLYLLLMGGQGTPPNPLVTQDPMRLYRLTADLLQAHEKRDVENYIGTEEELQQQKREAELMQAAQYAAQNGALPPGFELTTEEQPMFKAMVTQMQQQAMQPQPQGPQGQPQQGGPMQRG